MKQALQNHVNLRFRRLGAYLGIIFITAQDDCSAADLRLFAPEDADLGPLTAFRCFEHGVDCASGGREPGPRLDCHPREDPNGLLAPVGAYIEYLQGIIEPQLLVVTAVTGPFAPQDTLTVMLDSQGHSRLAPSCNQDATTTATPAVRLHSLLAAFNVEEELSTWAQLSVCAEDYTPILMGSARHTHPDYTPCFELPLAGCSDPAAAEGLPGDGQPCNDNCQPRCRVTDVQQRGTDEETQTTLPPCLEVCANGPCPGNTDPALAYAGGRPVERDYRLPAEACWYARTSDWCQHGSSLVVARQADPPPRTFVDMCCELIPAVETICDDGLDGDSDCLVDLEDPDCAEEQL